MGLDYPKYPTDVTGGDEATYSPAKGQHSLLGAEVGTQRTKRILIGADGGLLVHGTNFGSYGSPINVFSEVDAGFSVETTILTYTVPAGQTFSVTRVVAWGDWDGEYLIRVDGVLHGGGRTSVADRTLNIPYDTGPIIANSAQVVTVTITHYNPATKHFRANLLGGLQ
jgi:hypothetical protein